MKLRIFYFACLSLAMISCRENDLKEPLLNGKDVTFVAVTEETRVAFNDDLTQILWEAGDSISVLDGFSKVVYGTSEEGRKVKFTSSKGISDEALDVYAVYPHDGTAMRLEDGVELVVPSEQNVDTALWDSRAAVAVAYAPVLKAETELKFENICSFFKFTVPAEDKIVQVILEGGEGEWLAGAVNATFADGELQTEVTEGTNRITFTSETPMSGTYVIPLLPCVLQEGLNVALKNSEGRSAMHRVIAKGENDVVTAVTFSRNKINRFSLSFEESVWKDAPEVRVLDVAATTVTFAWSESDFSDPVADFATKYRVDLYSDAGCKTPVNSVKWEIADAKTFPCPALCFSGLVPETDYWVTVTDSRTHSTSLPEKVTTTPDDSVSPEGQAAEGQVVLKETFAQLGSGADPLNVAWGILDGALTSAPGAMAVWSETDLSGTRLADWGERTEGANYVGPGYVRVGDSKNQKDALYTPALSSLKEHSTLEVTFKAAPYSSDYGAGGASKLGECYVEVWVVNGEDHVSAGVVELNDDPTDWTECFVEAYNVLPTSRIAIGGAFGEKTQTSNGKQYARIYLDDVQVKLVRYEKFTQVKPEVNVEKTFWSDSYITWTCSGEPVGYKVYVNGEAVTQTLEATVKEYHVTGLPVGTTSEISVAAVYANGKEAMSSAKTVTTGAIVQLTKNLSPTSLSIYFEPCGSIKSNVDAAYYIQLSKNADMSDPVYDQYIVDGKHVYNGHPFVACPVSGKDRAETRIALGNLEPNTTYYFRVRSDLKSYVTFAGTHGSGDKEFKLSSTNSYASEFSLPVAFTTSSPHEDAADEVLYEGFDGFSRLADFVNYAVGTETQNVSDTDGNKYWSFASLRYGIASTQIAHYKWSTNKNDKKFDEIDLSANSEVAAFDQATSYKVNATSPDIVGWYVSNNTWGYQGYLGMGLANKYGYIVTPAIESSLLSSDARSCSLSFKAVAAQDYDVTIQVSVYESDTDSWRKVGSVKVEKAGEINNFDYKWHDCVLSEELLLKKGDHVALSTSEASGLVFIDEIKITTK